MYIVDKYILFYLTNNIIFCNMSDLPSSVSVYLLLCFDVYKHTLAII